MTINIKDLAINYIQYGNGKKDIILLHGWRQNIKMMQPLGDLYQNEYRITILDLPGFGESDEPKEPWTIYEYESFLENFCQTLKINNPIVIGHSFGGRIAIIYAARNIISKLVLLASPVSASTNKSFKTKILKVIAKITILNKLTRIAKKHIGSADYRNASDIMRKILVNVINEDLNEWSKKIDAPTLIIWGEDDKDASIEDAKLLEQNIKDSGLIIFPNSTHYAYLENLNDLKNILDNFL